MTRIILIGYMGAGKTTLGKALAREMNVQFCDLDWFIEERYHRTIQQIFDEKGEAGFRDIERKMLYEVADFENIVISCGGGTPCFFDNIEFMNSKAQTVYLKATPEILFQHLELMQYITESLAKREPFYSKADYIFDITLLNSIDRIKDSVRLIQELLNKQAE